MVLIFILLISLASSLCVSFNEYSTNHVRILSTKSIEKQDMPKICFVGFETNNISNKTTSFALGNEISFYYFQAHNNYPADGFVQQT